MDNQSLGFNILVFMPRTLSCPRVFALNGGRRYHTTQQASCWIHDIILAKTQWRPSLMAGLPRIEQGDSEESLPATNNVQMSCQGNEARIFSKLDLMDRYHLINVKKGGEWRTGFRTRDGLYKCTVIPFGLTNSPAAVQSMMNKVRCECVDRVVVFTSIAPLFTLTLMRNMRFLSQRSCRSCKTRD